MPENTPHHEDAVRRRLAEARHTDPVPADVAARLDATLADLVADRAAVAEVVPLRRRRWPAVLAAAAAVTALGFALPTLTGDDDSTHQMADKAVTAESAAGPWSRATLAELGYSDVRRLPEVFSDAAALDAPLAVPGETAAEAEEGRTANELDGLRDQRKRSPEDWFERQRRLESYGYLDKVDRTTSSTKPCGPVTLAPGVRLFTARSDGHRVLLARHQPTADGVLVEVYDCSAKDPATPAETFTLPPAE